MEINNFEVIENFMDFEEGSYYKFEALIRNTDGENPLYYEGCSNVNKNILIKSWYVDSREYYEKVKKEMQVLCDLTGARLYITLDRKSTKRTVINLFRHFSDKVENMLCGSSYGIKSISKEFASCTSIKDSSEHDRRTLMWDVDVEDNNVLEALLIYVREEGHRPYVLKTKKGYHVFCYKKFNNDNWRQESCDSWLLRTQSKRYVSLEEFQTLTYNIKEKVSVKDNTLGLVYMKLPCAENEKGI